MSSASFRSSVVYRALAVVQVAMLLVVLWLAADHSAHRQWHGHTVSEAGSHSQCRSGNHHHHHHHQAQLAADFEQNTAVHDGSESDGPVPDDRDSGEEREAHGCVIELVLQGQALSLIWGAVVVPVWKSLDSSVWEGPTPVWISTPVGLLPFSCGPPASGLPSTC